LLKRPVMKFGLHFLLSCAEHQTPRQIYREAIDQCVFGEALGFESAWPVEHHFNLEVSSLSCPTLLLAAIAERTERLRLGTAIVQLPLAHPLRVAEELATLDVLSGGRVELGIGRGSNPAHFAGFGVPPSESRERLSEGLALIRTAWTQDRFTFEGKYWQAHGASVVPRPVQTPHPRIHVAANSPETAAFAGQSGCAALFAAHVNPFPKLKGLLEIYRNARREAGHGEAAPEDVTLLMPTYVAPTLQQVRDEFEASILHSSQLAASLLQIVVEKASEAERTRLLPLLEHLRSIDFEKVRTTMGVAGTPADIRDRFAEIEREFNPGRVIAWFNYGGLVAHANVTQSMSLFAKTLW
jgi:alkanesulfonate monooxygenase SsuD/methylene tetrahydromethanopterin reductase-like flavin-dependent oxidoreductase (luciferase family)